MRPGDFEFLSVLVKEQSCLVLTEDKSFLLESRLMPVARKRGLKGLEELVDTMKAHSDVALVKEVTESNTTNESFYFREKKKIELFREQVLTKIISNRA